MESKKWARVVWRENGMEEEGDIPLCWVNDKHVMWPKGANVLGALKGMKTPTEKWIKFDLIKIKLTSVDQQRCEDYDLTTSNETEDENTNEELGKRQSKKKNFSDFVTDHDEVDLSRESEPGMNIKDDVVSSKKDSRSEKEMRPVSRKINLPTVTPKVQQRTDQPIVRSVSNSPPPKQQVCQTRSASKSPRKKSSPVNSIPRNSTSKKDRPIVRSNSSSPPPKRQVRQSWSRSPSTSPRKKSTGKGPVGCRLRSVERERCSEEPFVTSTPSTSEKNRSRFMSLFVSPSPSKPSSKRQQGHRSRSRSRRSRSASRSRSPSISAPKQKSGANKRKRSPSCESISLNHSKRTVEPGASTSSQKSGFPLSEERFQRRVLFLLSEIRDSLKKPMYEGSVEPYSIRQMATLDELEELEVELRDPSQRALLKTHLMKIGGVDGAEHVKKTMLKTMSNGLMAKINMNGKGKKFPFKNTSPCKIIIDSVLAFHQVVETFVEDEIKRFLKYAPERTGGGGRKK